MLFTHLLIQSSYTVVFHHFSSDEKDSPRNWKDTRNR